MDNLIETLVAMTTKENTNYQSILPLGKGIGYFRMSECTVNSNETALGFLKKLQSSIEGIPKIDEIGSGRYFFDVGGKTILEVATIIERNTITIVPYILYYEDDVRESIQKNIVREQKIYQIFKQVGLQK